METTIGFVLLKLVHFNIKATASLILPQTGAQLISVLRLLLSPTLPTLLRPLAHLLCLLHVVALIHPITRIVDAILKRRDPRVAPPLLLHPISNFGVHSSQKDLVFFLLVLVEVVVYVDSVQLELLVILLLVGMAF
jgi:hypothetical protein